MQCLLGLLTSRRAACPSRTKLLNRTRALTTAQVLALTSRLRYHDLAYIRGLAAQSLGFLFRHAAGASLRAGVRTLAAEAAARPAARTEPAGQLLAVRAPPGSLMAVFVSLAPRRPQWWPHHLWFCYPVHTLSCCFEQCSCSAWDSEKLSNFLVESRAADDGLPLCLHHPQAAVKGMDQGLHSKAGEVWALLLRPDLLRMADFKSAKVWPPVLRFAMALVSTDMSVYLRSSHVSCCSCGAFCLPGHGSEKDPNVPLHISCPASCASMRC